MKKSLRCIRWLASIASLALFVYVLERSGPAAGPYELPVFWQGARFPGAPPGMPVLFKPL
jgi:hypothetical protein